MTSFINQKVFVGVDQLTESTLINTLEENMKTYLDWGFLNIGGYINIDIPVTGLYGGNFHQLKTTETPGYKIGQVWQGPKKDWVWETGVYYNDGYFDNNTPNIIDGIYVNNTFVVGPTGVATTGYHINYPQGQVVFDRPISKNSKVELNYSYRWCQVYKSSSTPWRELQELTYKPAPQINQTTRGEYNTSPHHRVQMPCIIIEPIARSSSRGHQLGTYSLRIDQDILCHVFTETAIDKNRIVDIIRLQEGTWMTLYDPQKVVNNEHNPLDYQGSVNPSGLVYPDLKRQYQWTKTYFKNIEIMDMESININLYWCTIRITSETIR